MGQQKISGTEDLKKKEKTPVSPKISWAGIYHKFPEEKIHVFSYLVRVV